MQTLRSDRSIAEQMSDIVVHFAEDGKPIFTEILKSSKIIPPILKDWQREKQPRPNK